MKLTVPSTPLASGSSVPPWPSLTLLPGRALLRFRQLPFLPESAFSAATKVSDVSRSSLSELRSFIVIAPDGLSMANSPDSGPVPLATVDEAISAQQARSWRCERSLGTFRHLGCMWRGKMQAEDIVASSKQAIVQLQGYGTATSTDGMYVCVYVYYATWGENFNSSGYDTARSCWTVWRPKAKGCSSCVS